MPPATEILLVRHAQSLPSAAVHYTEWPLSDAGLQQAQELAPLLAALAPSVIFSSPYRRCVETIRPFAQAAGLQLQLDERLGERLVSETLLDDFYAFWTRSWRDFDYALPACESSRQAQARMVAAVQRISAACSGARVAVCSHGYVIGLLAHHLDPSFGQAETEELRNPDVLRVVAEGSALSLDRAFACPGLEAIATGYQQTPYLGAEGEQAWNLFAPKEQAAPAPQPRRKQA